MSYKTLSKYRSELMGLAMLSVLWFHAFDLDMGVDFLNRLRSMGFGGVDVFILLSSVGLAMSLARRESDYGTFLRRRMWRLLPAYFAVMLPYTVYLIVRDGVSTISIFWNSTLLYYWVRSDGAFNWYVAGAMVFYALTPPAFRRLRASRHREGLTALWILLALFVCQWMMHAAQWPYMDVFFRLPVFFLGLLMGFFAGEDRRIGGFDALIWTLSLALGIGYAHLCRVWTPDWPIYLQTCHTFLLTTVPFCLLCCFLFEKLPLGGLRRVLALLGDNSLGIYLLNVSVFSRTEELRSLLSFAPTPVFYLISFALNIVFGCLLNRFVEVVKKKLSHGAKNAAVC